MAYTLEAWAVGPVHGKQRAAKVLVMLESEPDERDVFSATSDATAVWRRWFIMGKKAEKINGKTGLPDPQVFPASVGHKVTQS